MTLFGRCILIVLYSFISIDIAANGLQEIRIQLRSNFRRTIQQSVDFTSSHRQARISLRAPTTSARLSLLETPLIGSSDEWGNWAVLAGSASLAQTLGSSTRIFRLLGPPVSAMALTFLMASTGVLSPGGTAASRSLQILSLQLATPLILLGADLRDAGKRCGPLLVSFLAASLATLTAALVGWSGTSRMLTSALGSHDGLVIASALLAKNIGGGINYVAVCTSLGASSLAVAAGLCVDNIFALLYFPVTSALAQRYPDVVNRSPKGGRESNNDITDILVETKENTNGNGEKSPDDSVTVQTVSNAIFLTAILIWLGARIGGSAGALPCATLLTVLFASTMPRRYMEPLRPAAECLGMVCLYLFFSTAGAPGIAIGDAVRASILPLSLFLTCLYSIHGLILTIFNKVLGRDIASFQPQRLLVASSAAIGGPATAVALAESAGWKSLAVPSLLVGNVGYAVATFIGIAFFSVFGTPS